MVEDGRCPNGSENRPCIALLPSNNRIDMQVAGYWEGAGLLLKHVTSASQADACTLVYPIFFLYRHAIELSLKRIIFGMEEPEGGHDLNKLWKRAEPVINRLPKAGIRSNQDEARRFIAELSKLDSTSQTFRYPVERGRKAKKTLLQGRFDLTAFGSRAQATGDYLSDVFNACDTEIANQREKRHAKRRDRNY